MRPIATICSISALLQLAPFSRNFRVNASHMDAEGIVSLLEELDRLIGDGQIAGVVSRRDITLYIDLQGSKMRLSGKQEEVRVLEGQRVNMVGEGELDNNQSGGITRILVPEHTLNRLLELEASNLEVSIEDGRIKAHVVDVDKTKHQLAIVIDVGGVIRPRKGLNTSPHPHHPVTLSPRDVEVVEKTRRFPFVAYALSFASTREEVAHLRTLAGNEHRLAAKVELPLDTPLLNDMAVVVDEFWLCRGDLGAQLGLRQMALYYRQFCSFVSKNHCTPLQGTEHRVSFTLAGEVLEHMVSSPTPTRSEVCHLVDAVSTGFDSCVLSNETAYGKYPVEAIGVVKDVTEGLPGVGGRGDE